MARNRVIGKFLLENKMSTCADNETSLKLILHINAFSKTWV